MMTSKSWWNTGLMVLVGVNIVLVIAVYLGNFEVVFSSLMTDIMVVCFILDHGEDLEEEEEKKEVQEHIKEMFRDLPL